ncbi:MAG: protein kinase [Bacteroidales bacterium]|nr:protein kinase [Bacteroidales bacterium]
MNELTRGEKVTLSNGGYVTIKKELGRGGQGIVYLVDYNGKDMALKWYLNAPDSCFYTNLNNNILNGAPSDAFLWPKALAERRQGSFGYLMDLRPGNYSEFGNFLMAKAKFASFDAMLNAAMKICNGFMMLHRFGYSYQDLNDGNFFIDPKTGDVLICDNDNVMPQGEKSGIMGKARYMAPEVVAGNIPDKYSDRFSLSVILFMLFYANHPFEGAKVVACPCLTEVYEKKFYGSEAVFIYNPADKSNLPVRGIHRNVIRRWPVLPSILRDTFTREFSEEMLRNPQKRMIEQNWEKLIVSLRDCLVICPHCKGETFIEEGKSMCMNCGKDVEVPLSLKISNRNVFLTGGTKLYIDHDNNADVLVLKDAKAGLLLLKNLSSDTTWTAETPSGKLKTVAPGECVPVKEGIKVSFNQTTKGEIISR